MKVLMTRIPPTVLFGILAFLLTVLAGAVWTVLLIGNLATSPTIPWSGAVMAVLLWVMWAYLGGWWGPQSTSLARRHALRARLLPAQIFAWALLTGLLSLVALIGFWLTLFQLVSVPARVLPSFAGYPLITVLLVLIMASLVSSLAEEAGFRGYFLGELERKVSAPLAIALAALVIAPAHGLTQGFAWSILLWYFCADVMFGAPAFFTKSILPGAIVHSLGLLVFFTLIWPSAAQRHLIWKTGATMGFWLDVALTLLFTVLGLLAFIQLALITRKPAVSLR